jgi:hypothetical protein
MSGTGLIIVGFSFVSEKGCKPILRLVLIYSPRIFSRDGGLHDVFDIRRLCIANCRRTIRSSN